MGITHKWNGTVLTVTSDSGTSSADLKGATGDTGARGAQGPAGGALNDTSLIDKTLTIENYAADAFTTGQKIADLANTVTQSVQSNEKSGDALCITDANDGGLSNLIIYGKTTQAGAPTPEAPVDLVGSGGADTADKVTVQVSNKNLFALYDAGSPQTVNGITATKNYDGSITLSGTSEDTTKEVLITFGFMVLSPGKYRLTGSDGSKFRLRVGVRGGSGALVGHDTGNGLEFELTEVTKLNFAVRSMLSSKVDSSYLITIYPMLTALEADRKYQEPINNKARLLIQNELNGIPVRASEGGNYIDGNGQHWVCDEVDIKNKKLIQRVKKVVIDGSTGKYDSTTAGMFMINVKEDAKAAGFDKNTALCSHYPFGAYANADMPDKHFKVHCIASTGEIYIYIKDSTYTTNEEFKSGLAANPITIIYQLQEPKEIAITSETALAQFEELKTFKPITTIISTGNTAFKANYMIDIKTYIDNKFNELQAALISLGGNV